MIAVFFEVGTIRKSVDEERTIKLEDSAEYILADKFFTRFHQRSHLLNDLMSNWRWAKFVDLTE
jgi:hypothetical protein